MEILGILAELFLGPLEVRGFCILHFFSLLRFVFCLAYFEVLCLLFDSENCFQNDFLQVFLKPAPHLQFGWLPILNSAGLNCTQVTQLQPQHQLATCKPKLTCVAATGALTAEGGGGLSAGAPGGPGGG